jgi:hypothetical protein
MWIRIRIRKLPLPLKFTQWADLLYGSVDPVRQSLLLETVHGGISPRPSLLRLFKQLMRRLLQQLMPTLSAFELPYGGAADSRSLEYRCGGSFRRSAVSHGEGGLTSEKRNNETAHEKSI